MNIEIKYSKDMDLVLHALAHMKVDNASDLYDKSYINLMNREKGDFGFDIHSGIKALEQYYNENYNRLILISFLPFCCSSLDEIKNIFISQDRFTQGDKSRFIIPFIEILERESVFYFEYWQSNYKSMSQGRYLFENFLKKELEKYSRVFDYYYKSALVYLSSSITKNGRGFDGIDSYFTALAPFPNSEQQYESTLFQLLHEYTHQFTDALLRTNISMTDGSHALSEITVFLTDYYIVKALDPSALENYIKWASADYTLSESDFLRRYRVEDSLDLSLRELVRDISNFK